MAAKFVKREMAETAVAQRPNSIDQGISNLIGGFLIFGLAAIGLAIGYSSTTTQWTATGALVTLGFMLIASGICTIFKKSQS